MIKTSKFSKSSNFDLKKKSKNWKILNIKLFFIKHHREKH